MSERIVVRMLGGFSLEYDGGEINDSSNRMYKVWLLLAYLIYYRNSRMTQENFLSVLRSVDGDEPADPSGRLKAMFYRVRAMLNRINGNAGHDLIVRRGGSYAWNNEVPLWLDVEEFDSILRSVSESDDSQQRLEKYMKALELYRGDFLPKLSTESWVLPVSAYYHGLYLETVGKALELLEGSNRWAEAAALCEKALGVEPYSEEIYQHLMRCRIANGDRAGAQRAYEDMSDLLFSVFGVMPSDESRSIYREASREEEVQALPVGMVREQLREPNAGKGAMFCEYDFFRMLYQAQARAVVRSGDTVHIALFTLRGRSGKELARRSLDLAMNNLQDIIVSGLRQGDVVTRCSVSQFIVMLPQANYENSCKVSDRLVKAFYRKHPHSPADVHVSVHPLEPLDPTGRVGAVSAV